MGIHGLFPLLKKEAPNSYIETDKKKYTDKVIAIDASIFLYQFMIQIRTRGENGFSQMLTDSSGDVTSHLQGFLSRTVNLLENKIKPVFVFDGKPPELKFQELLKRKELKKKAENEMKEAMDKAENAEDSDTENMALEEFEKASKRNIHITHKQIDEVKKLVRLMGLPIVEAPCEAEAQCAELVKKGKVYATSTEDMDSLTFGTLVVLRKLTMPDSAKEKVVEINFEKVLEGLCLSHEEFIDFCILCGCDYSVTIKGIGPKTALKMIRQYKNIETAVDNMSQRYTVPEGFMENLEQVRSLFKSPNVIPAESVDIYFQRCDKEELMQFLVVEKGFNEERVMRILERLGGPKSKIEVDSKQPSIEAFFEKKEERSTKTVMKQVVESKLEKKQPGIEDFFKKKE